ncbi:uncharacterized protein Nmag_0110 [Natrialba magadii ATCC 43099]|uniref:Uncharacterized protein n=1 Tax=Natrialba magadii (strain ATCC 43099 / DSM 3394 / CCM 3739 / CIP 104546 / IAM 13178 / JCM 8861 / NBRC 102185 / NCIMB 2190 / MS3) TaxID=547559 RepID=D3SWB6_NATMM|nr:hypothetical protein [Natrialba magadii]ADD03708.1 uncharacterized protein Nmag_0110 [Natrialba magadii ATCC 43099]ELY33764.1 hypothetical protein C500_01023 [Natrialba magadii ATCC 43099]
MGATRSRTRRLPTLGTRAKRWPAYLLAICWPGAGHCVRRQWARGCSWALLCATALVFLSGGALLEGGLAEPLVVTSLRHEALAFHEFAIPLAIVVLNVLDLYLHTAFVTDRRTRS